MTIKNAGIYFEIGIQNLFIFRKSSLKQVTSNKRLFCALIHLITFTGVEHNLQYNSFVRKKQKKIFFFKMNSLLRSEKMIIIKISKTSKNSQSKKN